MTERAITRRALLAACAGALLAPERVRGQDAAPEQGVAPLPDPARAGLPRSRVTDYENDPFIVGVESELRCTCGCNLSVYTCRTTDFTCQTSPAMHRQVIALVQEGRTAQEILDDFVARHGETVLMAPPKRGFNIAAYVVPGIGIVTVGSALAWVLVRRTRRPLAAAAGEGGDRGSALSTEDAARLEVELKRLER